MVKFDGNNQEKFEEKIKNEWEKITGVDTITVYVISSAAYAFGSELSCLRLSNKLHGRCDYSLNRNSFFYCEELTCHMSEGESLV